MQAFVQCILQRALQLHDLVIQLCYLLFKVNSTVAWQLGSLGDAVIWELVLREL